MAIESHGPNALVPPVSPPSALSRNHPMYLPPMRNLLLILLLIPFASGCDDSPSDPQSDSVDSDVDAGTDADSGDADLSDSEVIGPLASWAASLDEYDKGAFLSVWGRSADDVFVAGGTDETGALLHHDGDDWTEVALPDGTPLLNWVFGIDDALWVVGAGGTVLYRPDDDSEWARQIIGTTEPLWGIWGTSKDQLWTVGGDSATGDASPGLVFAYDGTSWNEQFPPEGEDDIDAFFKVWGTSADNVYVVGSLGRILHWDGSAWTGESVVPFRDLVSLWGSGPDNIYISGGRAQAVLLTRNDDSWDRVNTASFSAPGLNGTWVEPDGRFGYSVGVTGTILRFDSEDLSVIRESGPTNLSLHGVWGDESGNTIFAVGGNLEAGSLDDGVILKRTKN